MAIVTLVEDPSKKANTKLKAGEGIHELLYFPRVPKDLEANTQDDDDDSNYIEELWALQEKRFSIFNAEIKKYDDAAAKLHQAREQLANASGEEATKNAKTEVENAQENMRKTLLKGFNDKDNDIVTPLPKGAGKNLIECIGLVSKRLYYISIHDLKKVENEKGRKTFRFENNIEDTLFESIKEHATDSSTGQTDDKLEAQQSDEDKKKKKVWKAFQKKINKEWKLYENETEGTLKLKRLEKYVPKGAIQDFLRATNTCGIVDNFVKLVNDSYNFSKQQKDQKREKIKTNLEKTNDDFTHYHWGQVRLLVQQIWGQTDEAYVRSFLVNYREVPFKEKERKAILEDIYSQKLPEVVFDYGGGAQLMRYTCNCSVANNFDFSDGKFSASFEGKAKLALAEAGVDTNLYFPNNNGVDFKFKVPVFKEVFIPVIEQEESSNGPTPMFADDSSFMLPSAMFDVGEQLQGISIVQKNVPKDQRVERFIQIAGHTDTTGSDDYNKILSYQRAKSNHALFTNDIAQWQEYFERGMWGDEERDMIELSLYMKQNSPTAFKERFVNMKVGDTDNFDTILLRELREALDQHDYPESKIRSSKMRSQLLNPRFTDGGALTFAPKGLSNDVPSDKVLIKSYQTLMKDYLLNELKGVDEDDFNLFYVDTELYPVLGYGENNQNIQKEGKVAANRRVTLRLWEVKADKRKGKAEINLGRGRLHIHGQISGYVGATIGVSGGLDLNTYKGTAQLVGKKKKDDIVVRYNDNKELQPYDKLAPGNFTVNPQAFVGAKAEASLSASLEWDNPDKRTSGFSILASVGGVVTGTAGAGIEGEFRIGFDRVSRTFQVKLKAQATWGLGCGGAWSLSVGVQELYDFVVLVYQKLEENDFNFIDIFEDKEDSKGERTESDINVYEVYIAWVAELWKQKEYFKLGAAVLSGVTAVHAISFLDAVDELLAKYQENRMNKQETQNIINNILANSAMMRYTPPKAKGHMLYMITRYKSSGWSEFVDDVTSFDLNVNAEGAAIKLIETITHAREWQEVMEHMAVKTNDGKSYDPYHPLTINNYKYKGNILRMQHSVHFLRNELLDEYKDWKKVKNHLTGIKNWNKAWNKDID